MIGKNQELPAGFSQKLFQRFSSSEGYELQPGVTEILRHLRNTPPTRFDRVVVGVITNSDDRVPGILSSLGLQVGPLRYGVQSPPRQKASMQEYDLDFTVMSYDVGHEKPDVRIFRAAEEMLDVILQSQSESSTKTDLSAWENIYVGDEYDKDVVGAHVAGWYAILVSSETPSQDVGMKWLEDATPGDLLPILASSEVVGARTLRELEGWLLRAIEIRHL